MTVARDLLTESGAIFVQIGDENVHRVRALMDEVFGADNCVTEIVVKKKGSQKSSLLDPVNDFILWYSKAPRADGVTKFRALFEERDLDSETVDEFSRAELPSGSVVNLKSYTSPEAERVDFRAYPRRIELEFPGARLFPPWPITNGGERANQMDLPFTVLDERVHTARDRVSVGTMHLSKELEFRAVVVMACDDEILPLQARIEGVTDEADLREVYDTERHLLYVACTRARDDLLVTAVEPGSEFVDDLRR